MDFKAELQDCFDKCRSQDSARKILEWARNHNSVEAQQVFRHQIAAFRKVATRSSCMWLLEVVTSIVILFKTQLDDTYSWSFELKKTGSWCWKGLRDDNKANAVNILEVWIELQLVSRDEVGKILQTRSKSYYETPQKSDQRPLKRWKSESSASGRKKKISALVQSSVEKDSENAVQGNLLCKIHDDNASKSGEGVIGKKSKDSEVVSADLDKYEELRQQQTAALVTPTPPAAANEYPLCSDLENNEDKQSRADNYVFRMIKLDGCALIRHVGKAMGYGERAMLSAFYFFHHFQWLAPDMGMRFPLSDLPSVCLACLHLAGKAEDTSFRIDYLLSFVHQLNDSIPPYPIDSFDIPRGQVPTCDDVLHYEFQILETLKFNTTYLHPSKMLGSVREKINIDPSMWEKVPDFFQTRMYTDSDVCIQGNVVSAIAAAILYLNMTEKTGDTQWAASSDGVERLEVSWPIVADFLSQYVQTSKDVKARAPVQTLFKVKLVSKGSGSTRYK